MSKDQTCDEAFLGSQGEVISCDRPDTFHIVHRDPSGTTAIPLPGGAFISKRGQKRK